MPGQTGTSQIFSALKEVITRPTGHEAPALLKHNSSASFISIMNHSSALLALLALLKLLALLVLLALLALLKLLALSFWSHPRVILESY